MAVYTLLDKQQIENILQGYAIGELMRFEMIASGIENSNYFIWTDQHLRGEVAWVLTIFENLSEASLPFYNALTLFLGAQGFRVPAPLQRRSGDYSFTLAVFNEEQATVINKTGLIVPKFSGEAIAHPSREACEKIATYLGVMHKSLRQFALSHPIDHSSAWLRSKVENLLPLMAAEDARLLSEAWTRYERYQPLIAACPQGIIHGDLFRDNVLFEGDEISGVIDFYHAGESALLFDLAVVVNDWALDDSMEGSRETRYDQLKLHAILDAYRAERDFTFQEREAWPYVLELAALRFWLSRLQTLHMPGYQQGIKAGDNLKSPDAMKGVLKAAMAI